MAETTLNALESRLLDVYRAEPERTFTTADLLQHVGCHADALRRARNKLWRAGLIEVGCRGNSQLKSRDQCESSS